MNRTPSVVSFVAAMLSILLCAPMVAGKQASQRSREPVAIKFVQDTPVSVITPDVPKLPWTLENGVKVFHLTAEVVKREILPASGMVPSKVVTLWGYNGSVPGPTIEVNEGDHVRIIFHNNLPEDSTVHWHGLEIPIEMDGLSFISQPPVKPGGSFTYEFTLHQNGTYFYHSHGAMQEMMGMIGFFIIHPKKDYDPPVQKDFGIIVQEFAVLPNNPIPNSMSMEFNWLTMNGKAAPATTPLIIRQGDRVRIRLVNLSMDHHPIHLHGNQFYETGTEGGRAPKCTWRPENTVLVGVAQARDIEFNAVHPGDWMLHCHLPHHMMNNMVSMVGPMTMSDMQHGMQTGMGMEEGMGIVRQGNATSEELGPGLGRGMSNTADRERNISHRIHQNQEQNVGVAEDVKSKPGYPQDAMMMPMDNAVAKPETNYLAPGWSGSLAGMMTLVRVLPPEKYDKVMADIKAGRVVPTGGGMNMPGMEHMNKQDMKLEKGNMNMPSMKMEHGNMNMPSMKMEHGKSNAPKKSTQRKAAATKSKSGQAKQKPMTMEEMMKKKPNMKM